MWMVKRGFGFCFPEAILFKLVNTWAVNIYHELSDGRPEAVSIDKLSPSPQTEHFTLTSPFPAWHGRRISCIHALWILWRPICEIRVHAGGRRVDVDTRRPPSAKRYGVGGYSLWMDRPCSGDVPCLGTDLVLHFTMIKSYPHQQKENLNRRSLKRLLLPEPSPMIFPVKVGNPVHVQDGT